MQRIVLTLILAAALLFVSVPVQANAVTDSYPIRWIKAHPTGVLFSLEGFKLADVDPATCAAPGSPNFWIPAGSANAETLIAVLLTAQASDRPVKVRYLGCSNYTPSSPMLDVWMLHID